MKNVDEFLELRLRVDALEPRVGTLEATLARQGALLARLLDGQVEHREWQYAIDVKLDKLLELLQPKAEL